MASRAARRHTHGQCCQKKRMSDGTNLRVMAETRFLYPLQWLEAGMRSCHTAPNRPRSVFHSMHRVMCESRTGVTWSHELSRVFRQCVTEILKCVRFGFGKRSVRDGCERSVTQCSQCISHRTTPTGHHHSPLTQVSAANGYAHNTGLAGRGQLHPLDKPRFRTEASRLQCSPECPECTHVFRRSSDGDACHTVRMKLRTQPLMECVRCARQFEG